jgi:hypothetical protein
MDAVSYAWHLQLWHDVHRLLVGKIMKAFPNPHRTDETGMTLRDYFAGLAMQGLLTAETVGGYSNSHIAEIAYSIADAMLKERENYDRLYKQAPDGAG